uniref:Uncharacterized protein n=1 Tax=Cucumis sativus TaxID=3659 RepID=A0A0A0KCK9_CUCSA
MYFSPLCDRAGFLFLLPTLTPFSLLRLAQRYRPSAKILEFLFHRSPAGLYKFWVFAFSLPQSWIGTEETAMAPTKIPTPFVTLQLLLASRTPP